VLDTGPVVGSAPLGTLLAVHGNPTWSYLWRGLLADPPPGWRVVAPDHLGMGFSERLGGSDRPQRLADRVADLGALTAALDLRGPVVTVAHDWGGAISLGWALAHRDQVAGVVLTNTAVAQPPGTPVPALIALARTPGLLRTVCETTPAFVEGTLALARPRLSRAVHDAYRLPYRSAARRGAVADFVADIPLTDDHPSRAALDAIAAGLTDLADVPALLLWGPLDPVFAPRYLADLAARLPQAQVHRYEGAGHLLAEDRDVAAAVRTWLSARPAPGAPEPAEPAPRRWLGAAIEARADDDGPAVVERTGSSTTVTWAELAEQVAALAAGLVDLGVQPGDRVALLVPPGAELAAAVYACWRVGAVVVVADAGLGRAGLTRALRGAAPAYLVGIPRALAAARLLRWPGRRVAAGVTADANLRRLGADASLTGLAACGRDLVRTGAARVPADPPAPDAEAAVLFTSGATGPAKGVVYPHRRLEAQRDLLARTYAVRPDDRLVAAFAPFALYGPALGIASAVPDMDVTAPATLTAVALAQACAAVGGTLVFGSPAALTHVVATADGLTARDRSALAGVRLLLAAGAPLPVPLLRAVAGLVPAAVVHTPYGMTEALPVTDVSLAEVEAAVADEGDRPPGGVCVGRPLDGVRVGIAPLGVDGRSADEPVTTPYVTGEICVLAPHQRLRYDGLWLTSQASTTDAGWHRTGDVGHLDGSGRLWVEGRLGHVVVTARGPVTPVGIEQAAERVPGVARAAAVGVGPRGAQAVVLVVEPSARPRARRARRLRLAAAPLADAVRAAVAGLAPEVAAVLATPALPVDVRHQSKVDRAAVASSADRLLAGRHGDLPR
jgi:acyl-coenzyme A synthetase/AMP-(fatty) acid ligase/pimeloyl-ACP methyl ester carboxylesterase